MSDGIYAKINRRIRQLMSIGRVIIDRSDITNKLDVVYSEMDRKDLEERCKNADVAVVLYQNGFRSIVKGKGIFIDVNRLKNPIIRDTILNNLAKDIDCKKIKLKQLNKILASNNFGNISNEAQMQFLIDDNRFVLDKNNKPIFADEITRDELVEILMKMLSEHEG